MDLKFIRSRLESYSKDELIKIILKPVNRALFTEHFPEQLKAKDKNELIEIILSKSTTYIDNNVQCDFRHVQQENEFKKLYRLLLENPNYEPDKWKPRPHQIEHIDNLVAGLSHPSNSGRCAWDGSETGRGKTAAGVITAIRINVRFVLVICPDSVVAKWHHALGGGDPIVEVNEFGEAIITGYRKPMGLFNYRICTYDGIKGTTRDQVQWAKYKPYPDQLSKSEDMDWVQIRRTGKSGKNSKEYDWSFLPDMEGNSNLGGCLVIWDEVQNAKGKSSQIGVCFNSLMEYVHKEPQKFIRVLFLSASVMENVEDLPYLIHAFGYITKPTLSEQNKFIVRKLIPNFKGLMGDSWNPEMEKVDGKTKILLFVRTHLKKRKLFSVIPKPPDPEDPFKNKITFQPIRIADEDIGEFVRVNRSLEVMLLDMARNDAGNSGILGMIQKTLSKLEIYKLTPFTELGRKVLNTKLPNGSRGSLVFSMTRNSSVRYFAWRFEAIIEIMKLRATKPTIEQLTLLKKNLAALIYQEQRRYNEQEKLLIEQRQPLKLKSRFKQYLPQELLSMDLENLLFEYNKWIKYLDVTQFNHVCIFVGNFGDPTPTNFDLDSSDKNDWIKESKPFNRNLKETMKMLFQTNQRKIFITNIMIAREGIDLHDTSEGGMHPRTCIISPGIVARYLKQMLGRVVRDGQSSDSIRIIGFVDNLRGVTSWEAKFMEKMSIKIKAIDLLHTGKTELDIIQNIKQDDGSLLKAVLNDLRRDMNLGASSRPLVLLAGHHPLDQQVTEGEDAIPIEFSEVGTGTFIAGKDTIASFLQKTLGTKKSIEKTSVEEIKPIGKIPIKTIDNKLTIRYNQNYIFYDTTTNVSPEKIESIISDTLENEIKLDSRYFKVLFTNSYRGLVLFRLGIRASGISQGKAMESIILNTGLVPVLHEVGDRDLDFLSFSPEIIIENLLIVFDSPTTLLVGPRYPLESRFPESLLDESLSVNKLDSKVLKFEGITPKIILAFYACRAIAIFQEFKIIKAIKATDPNKILDKIDPRYRIQNEITNGIYFVVGHKDIMKHFSKVLSSVTLFIPELLQNNIFGKSEMRSNDIMGIEVKQKYAGVITALIGSKPTIGISKKLSISSEQDPKPSTEEIAKIQTEINNASSVVDVNTSEVNKDTVKINITDSALRYSPVGKIMSNMVIKTYGKRWSGLLSSRIEGSMIVFEPRNIDNRLPYERVIEFIELTCVIQYLSTIKGIGVDENIHIDMDRDLLEYIPRFSISSINSLWIAPRSVRTLLESLLKDTLPSLRLMPKSGIPGGVEAHFVRSEIVYKLLKPYAFLEEDTIRFNVLSANTAEIIGIIDKDGNVKMPGILESIIDEPKLGITVNRKNNSIFVTSTRTVKDKESGQDIKVSNYNGLIAYFIRLKGKFRDSFIFEENIKLPFSLKIVRSSLWTSLIVIRELIDQGLMSLDKDFIEAKQIGKLLIHRFSLTENGLKKASVIFSKGVQSTLFLVRSDRKAEIVTSDLIVIKILNDWIKTNPGVIDVVERTTRSVAFNSINYFNIMRVYFMIKLVRGATLVSQIDPENHVIGKYALRSIGENTEFGTLHILRIPSGNKQDIFLVSKEQRAVDTILMSVPESITRSITIKELKPRILGRKLTGSSLFYIHYVLDEF